MLWEDNFESLSGSGWWRIYTGLYAQIIFQQDSLSRRCPQAIYLRMNWTDANPSGDGYNEIGASLGLGLPLIDNRSLINISFEYVKRNWK